MSIVAFMVFSGALAVIAAVMVGTLLPAWPRVVAALSNAPQAPQPRLVLARRRAAVSQRPSFRAPALREAA